jgi:hypothetical protein
MATSYAPVLFMTDPFVEYLSSLILSPSLFEVAPDAALSGNGLSMSISLDERPLLSF